MKPSLVSFVALVIIINVITILPGPGSAAPQVFTVIINGEAGGNLYVHPFDDLEITSDVEDITSMSAELRRGSTVVAGPVDMTILAEAGTQATFGCKLTIPDTLNDSAEYTIWVRGDSASKMAVRKILSMHLYVDVLADSAITDGNVNLTCSVRTWQGGNVNGTVSVSVFKYTSITQYETVSLGLFQIVNTTCTIPYNASSDSPTMFRFQVDAVDTTTQYMGRGQGFCLGMPYKVSLSSDNTFDTLLGLELNGPFQINESILLDVQIPQISANCTLGIYQGNYGLVEGKAQYLAFSLNNHSTTITIKAPEEPGIHIVRVETNASGSRAIGLLGIIVTAENISVTVTPSFARRGGNITYSIEGTDLANVEVNILLINANNVEILTRTRNDLSFNVTIPRHVANGTYFTVVSLTSPDSDCKEGIGVVKFEVYGDYIPITTKFPDGNETNGKSSNEPGTDGVPPYFVISAALIGFITAIVFYLRRIK